MDRPVPDLSTRIAKVLALDPAVPALEFARHWFSWGDLGATADVIEHLVGPGERVAVLLRNRPAHVGLLLGLLRAGACVVTANPERGAERVRADLESLDVATIAGEPDDLAALAPTVRWLVSDTLGVVDTAGGQPTGTGRAPAGCRGRDAHEWDDRPAEAGAAHLRHAGARADRGQVLRAQGRFRPAAPFGHHHRQLAARAPRRAVPDPAVRERRPVVLPARAVPCRRMGGCGAAPPAADGQPRARRAAHGARRRPRSRRLREHPVGRLGHRTARTGRCRRVPREVRRAGVDLVRRDGIRRQRRGVEHRRPRRILGDEAGECGARRIPAPNSASSIPIPGARWPPAPKVCWK